MHHTDSRRRRRGGHTTCPSAAVGASRIVITATVIPVKKVRINLEVKGVERRSTFDAR